MPIAVNLHANHTSIQLVSGSKLFKTEMEGIEEKTEIKYFLYLFFSIRQIRSNRLVNYLAIEIDVFANSILLPWRTMAI